MAEPKADRCDVDEAQEAFGCLVVASGDSAGVFQLVEAALDEVAQPVEGTVHRDEQPAYLSHGDNRDDVTGFHGFANIVRVITPIRQQDAGLRQVVGHDQIEAQIVRRLPRRNLRPHGQAGAVDAEVDLGREVTP